MVRISNIKLLKMLIRNSRTPFVKIAKSLGVSETAIRKKVKLLGKEGVIKRFTAEVDHRKLGFEIKAMIGIDTKPEYLVTIVEQLKDIEKIMHLYTSSGDHMIMLECWFENSKKMREFVKELNNIKGITKVCPAIIIEKVK